MEYTYAYNHFIYKDIFQCRQIALRKQLLWYAEYSITVELVTAVLEYIIFISHAVFYEQGFILLKKIHKSNRGPFVANGDHLTWTI